MANQPRKFLTSVLVELNGGLDGRQDTSIKRTYLQEKPLDFLVIKRLDWHLKQVGGAVAGLCKVSLLRGSSWLDGSLGLQHPSHR